MYNESLLFKYVYADLNELCYDRLKQIDVGCGMRQWYSNGLCCFKWLMPKPFRADDVVCSNKIMIYIQMVYVCAGLNMFML